MKSNTVRREIVLSELDLQCDEFKSLLDELHELVDPLDLQFSDSQLRACLKHLLYVEQVNGYINLTRIVDLHEALILHIYDSLMLCRYIPDTCSRMLDMGTGAGYPGIPLSLVCPSQAVMLDSVGKKVNAVNAFIRDLHIDDAAAVHDRLESFALTNHQSFDVVVARALASLPVLVEYATPFLKLGGRFIVTKGNPDSAEVRSGIAAADICGLKLVDTDEFDLPRELGHRSVYIFEAVSNPKIKLPRNPGHAKREPLA